MNADELFILMNEIPDNYIEDYICLESKDKNSHVFIKQMRPIAISFAIVTLCFSALLLLWHSSQAEDPQRSIWVDMPSYSCFCELLPKGNYLTDLENKTKGTIQTSYIVFSDNAPNSICNLGLSMKDAKGNEININCSMNHKISAFEYIKNLIEDEDLTATDENDFKRITKKEYVNSITVYMAISSDEQSTHIVFSVENYLYHIVYFANDDSNNFIESFIEALLSGKKE